MGLNYSYLLFFERDHVWDALHGIAQVSNQHQPPTKIIFPDGQIFIPLEPYSSNLAEMHHTDRKLDFQIVMKFPVEDQEIIKYNRSELDLTSGNQIAIGYIYLTVYLNDRIRSSQDYVLFEFYSACTTMSYLFEKSASVQKGFIELLTNHHGVSGALDRELDGGRLFWFRGKEIDVDMFAYNTPDQIASLLAGDNENG